MSRTVKLPTPFPSVNLAPSDRHLLRRLSQPGRTSRQAGRILLYRLLRYGGSLRAFDLADALQRPGPRGKGGAA